MKRLLRQCVVLMGGLAAVVSLHAAEPDILISDFETDRFDKRQGKLKIYEGWKIEGDAFGGGPRDAQRVMSRRAMGYLGRYLISSAVHGDQKTGSITTPPFTLSRRYVKFLIGGGDLPGQACLNLLVDGRVVRSATGRDDDRLEAVAFDVEALKGKAAQIQVLDAHRGIWGHVNVDHLVLTDRARTARIIRKAPTPVIQTWTAQSSQARFQGALAVADGRLEVASKPIELKDLLFAIRSTAPMADKAPHEVHLKSGERWGVEILKMDKGHLHVRNKLFGQRQIPMTSVASLIFKPLGHHEAGKPGTLYPLDGDPIPGKLVWVKSDTVAIHCALGVVPIRRDRVRRFVLTAAPAAAANTDEIGLIDGGVLQGKLGLDGGQWSLKHAALGDLKLSPDSIRYVRRHVAHVSWLESLGHEVTVRRGPIGAPPAPKLIDGWSQSIGHFLRAIRLMPSTVVRYELPKGPVTLRAMLSPVPGAMADTTVRVRAEGKIIWEKNVGPSDAPISVAVKVPSSDHVELEVGFGPRLAFPCGVEWRDAHLVSRAGG